MLLSPLRYINPISGNRGGSVFSIAKSFYLDGVNEDFPIAGADIESYTIGDAGVEYTIFSLFKRVEIGKSEGIFNQAYTNGLYFNADNTIGFSILNSASTFLTAVTTSQYNLTTDWYFVIGTYKANETIGNRTKIYVNAVLDVASDNTQATQLATGSAFKLAQRTTTYGHKYQSMSGLIDRALTQSEITDFYNNGKPKDPQKLFGTNCKFLFNPDNSGDTAQFTVTDSVNSITTTSINMDDADKTPVTPYTDPIGDLVTKYGFLNAWSGEKVKINGTTTTAKDYLSEHDLSNPAVANQPTFNGGTSTLANRPTIVNDGIDDYLYKSVANWRGSDSSGCFIAVYDDDGTGTNNAAYAISSSDEATTNNYIVSQHWLSGLRPIIRTSGAAYSYYTTPANIFGTANVIGFGSNGTTNKAFINGVLQTKNTLAGTDTGQWMDEVLNRDSIVMFGIITNSTFSTAAPMKLAFVGYMPYTDDATIIACQNELKTIFGL